MIKLDDNLLQELGLGVLPPEEKKRMLAHIYETLEMRVGMELAKQMSDAQLNEFEEFINRNDEAGALRWLETNFPNYKDVVAAEFEKLKGEVRQVAPQIVASSQQAMQAGPVQQPQQYANGGGTPAGYPQQPMQPMGPPTHAQQQYAPQPQPYQNQPYQQPAYPQPQQGQGMPQQQPYPPQQPAYPQQQDASGWGQPTAQGQGVPQQQHNPQQYQQPQPGQQQQAQGDYDLAA